MRLWHYKLLPVLPDKMLVAEWRECIAIKRQWEKGTLKHRLVSYVQNYSKDYFIAYIVRLSVELDNRNIKYKHKYFEEFYKFCDGKYYKEPYLEHNDRYLKQCYYNLQEKYDRGIITKEEWQLIEDRFKSEVERNGNRS